MFGTLLPAAGFHSARRCGVEKKASSGLTQTGLRMLQHLLGMMYLLVLIVAAWL